MPRPEYIERLKKLIKDLEGEEKKRVVILENLEESALAYLEMQIDISMLKTKLKSLRDYLKQLEENEQKLKDGITIK